MSERKYYYIQNYSSHGEMAINHHAFETIALNAIKKIKDVKVYTSSKKSKKVNLYRPVSCEMGKNGLVKFKVNVALKKDSNIKKTCDAIKDEISNAILLAVETLKVEVKINIAAIND